MNTIIQVIIFAATTLAFLGIANYLSRGKEEKQRSRRLSGKPQQVQANEARKNPSLKSLLGKVLEPLGKMLSTSQNQFKLRQELQGAGYYGARPVTVFLGAKVMLAIGLPLVFLVYRSLLEMPLNMSLMVMMVLAVLGLRLPIFWLGRKTKKRRNEMQRDLADCLDLMVVCVESGLGIDAALMKISEKMAFACPELAQELRIVHVEMQAGIPRQEALRHLGERTGVKDIQSLVAKLIQSEKFGTSVAKSLRVHADTIREKRKQKAEEQAGKIAVKLLFPLVFFVFPALFVAILGPAALQMIATFGR